VEYALDRRKRTEAAVAVLFVDLDDFKTVNDSLGHSVGDELLVAVGERLREATRPSDTPARIGGDEFAVLLEDLDAEDSVVAVTERVLAAVSGPFRLHGSRLVVRASVGVAIAGPEVSAGDLLRSADTAMYTAKEQGKGRYELFEPRMHTAARRRLELRNELQDAVDAHAFVLHYQPVVELATSEIVGFEALIRWAHAERGLVPPGEFVPVLEETGLILPVGSRILAEACDAAARWSRLAERPVDVSVNISAAQLLDDGLVARVDELLHETGLQPSSLLLEITETVLMAETGRALAQLEGLKALGVKLAIDDFGTGYSALEYLRRFPVDMLKIARPFVDRVGLDEGATRLAEAIVNLGTSLGLRVVAEGIEREVERDLLRAFGCQLGQGFLFARPMPEQDVDRLVAAARIAA
jgi:diguanylate cyclase (GGDEF)-like protein